MLNLFDLKRILNLSFESKIKISASKLYRSCCFIYFIIWL